MLSKRVTLTQSLARPDAQTESVGGSWRGEIPSSQDVITLSAVCLLRQAEVTCCELLAWDDDYAVDLKGGGERNAESYCIWLST